MQLILDLACMMPFGFFNLQAINNIGLTVGDVGIVSIIVSAASIACNPLIGKFKFHFKNISTEHHRKF